MATFNGINLRDWRNSQGVSAKELGLVIHKDETAIYAFERGERELNSDELFLICKRLGNLNRYCDLMRFMFPNSYGVIHPDAKNLDLAGSIMKMYAEFEDLFDKKREIERDGADGRIDSAPLKEWLVLQLTEAVAAGQLLLNDLNT